MDFQKAIFGSLALYLLHSRGAGAAQPSITSLGTLPGVSESYSTTATGISADGRTVVGYGASPNGYRPFLWTQTSGMTALPPLPGARNAWAFAVSADGLNVAGYSERSTVGTAAVRWTTSNTIENLGTFSTPEYGINFRGLSISHDGTRVVGRLDMPIPPEGGARGFLWRSGLGLLDLGVVPGGAKTEALGISGDGLTVVGGSGNLNTPNPFVWTQAAGMADLGTLPGGHGGYAWAANYDGTVVTGHASACCGETHAFRWTPSGGMIDLGTTFQGTIAYGLAINADGSVIAGIGGYSNSQNATAMLWSPALGMVELTAYAESRGLGLSEWVLNEATGLSADGRMVVGNGLFRGKARAWIISGLPAPCIGASHHLAPQRVCPTEPAVFTAPIVSTGPIEYAWEVSSTANGPWVTVIDGVNLGPSGSPAFNASGAASSTLSIDNANTLPDAWATSHIYVRVRGSSGCDSATCLPTILQMCRSDVNCDGMSDLSDFFDFLNCFDQSQPCADIDGIDGVDLGDFFAFLNAFDQGC